MTSLILSGKSNGQRTAGELLRQDERGRVRTSRERREMLLGEFDRSGVSGARFAKMAGIKYQTFAGWLHERRRQAAGRAGAPKRRSPVTWLEAFPAPAVASGPSLRVEFPGGAWMVVGAEAQVRTAALLLRELAGEGGKSC